MTVVADMPFNFANIIVLPLILGIGVDSGIHLVHRHRRGLAEDGNLLHTSTASAVLFSALTTGASFATLAVSNHRCSKRASSAASRGSVWRPSASELGVSLLRQVSGVVRAAQRRKKIRPPSVAKVSSDFAAPKT